MYSSVTFLFYDLSQILYLFSHSDPWNVMKYACTSVHVIMYICTYKYIHDVP